MTVPRDTFISLLHSWRVAVNRVERTLAQYGAKSQVVKEAEAIADDLQKEILELAGIEPITFHVGEEEPTL